MNAEEGLAGAKSKFRGCRNRELPDVLRKKQDSVLRITAVFSLNEKTVFCTTLKKNKTPFF